MWNQPSMTSWADSDAESRLFYIDMFQFCCDQANCCAINSSPQSVVLSAPFLLVIVLIVSLLSIAILHCQWHDLNCYTCSVIRRRQTRTLLSPKKNLQVEDPGINTQRLIQIIIVLLFLASALAQTIDRATTEQELVYVLGSWHVIIVSFLAAFKMLIRIRPSRNPLRHNPP